MSSAVFIASASAGAFFDVMIAFEEFRRATYPWSGTIAMAFASIGFLVVAFAPQPPRRLGQSPFAQLTPMGWVGAVCLGVAMFNGWRFANRAARLSVDALFGI